MIARVVLAAALCVPAAGAAAQSVTVVQDRAEVAGCDALGEVSGSSIWGSLVAGAARESTLDEMKDKAFAMGATHLLPGDTRSGWIGTTASGRAYGCPLKRIAPAPRPRHRP